MRVPLWLLALACVRAALQCRWLCDDPVWTPVITPHCNATNCVFSPPCGYAVYTEFRCADYLPEDVETSCPQCEILAPRELQPDIYAGSIVICEQPECGWLAEDTASKPYPRCEEQCEKPACEIFLSNSARFSLF